MAIFIVEVYKRDVFYPQNDKTLFTTVNKTKMAAVQSLLPGFPRQRQSIPALRPHTFGSKGNMVVGLTHVVNTSQPPAPNSEEHRHPASHLLAGAVASALGAIEFSPLSLSAPVVHRCSLERTGVGTGGMAEGLSLQELLPKLCQSKTKWPFLNKTTTPSNDSAGIENNNLVTPTQHSIPPSP